MGTGLIFPVELGGKIRPVLILVTTVAPGLMRTGSPRNIDVKGNHEAEYGWFVLLDSLPLVSIHVERAAAKIVDAARYGDPSLIAAAKNNELYRTPPPV